MKEIRGLGHRDVRYRDQVFQLYDLINMRNLLTDKIAESAASNKHLFAVKPETIFDDMT